MISELLPRDILHLIVSLSAERYPDEELVKLLPPKFIREAYLAEVGVLAPLRTDLSERVRDWHEKQVALQTRANQIQKQIQEIEPFTQEMAHKGEFPEWAFRKWSEQLLFDWSADLEGAVIEAGEYLQSKKAPTH
jgi:hypothetical protein